MTTDLAVFVGVCLAVSISPGPAVFYIVARTLDQGVSGGFASMAGITLGGLVHVLLAAFGVAAAAAAWPASLWLLQVLGAAYLIWLGIRRVRADVSPQAALPTESAAVIFRQGVVVNLTNPKTVLFLLAFLPQFVVEGASPVWQQLLILGITFIVVAGLTDAGYVLAAAHVRRQLKGGSRWSRYLAGGVYVVLGILGLVDALRQMI